MSLHVEEADDLRGGDAASESLARGLPRYHSHTQVGKPKISGWVGISCWKCRKMQHYKFQWTKLTILATTGRVTNLFSRDFVKRGKSSVSVRTGTGTSGTEAFWWVGVKIGRLVGTYLPTVPRNHTYLPRVNNSSKAGNFWIQLFHEFPAFLSL